MELISMIILICSVETGEIVRGTCEVQLPRYWFSNVEDCDNAGYTQTITYLVVENDPNLRVEYYCHDWMPNSRQNEAL